LLPSVTSLEVPEGGEATAGRRTVTLPLAMTAVAWVCIAVVIWLSIAKI
jgi:hypothetical protein